MDGPVFQIFWKKGVCFPNIWKKYPLLRARRRPEGAAGGGARGIFSKYLENRPLFSKYLEKRPIHIFLIDTFNFFQITIIYKGTQVTIIKRMCNISVTIERGPRLEKMGREALGPRISNPECSKSLWKQWCVHASTLKSLQKTKVFASLGLQIMVQTMVVASLEVQVAIETMMLVTKILFFTCIYYISGSTNVISHGNS